MAGRPDKYTNEQITQALETYNGLVYLAARFLHCSPNTIYNRAKRVAKIQEVINNSRGVLVDHAELALRNAVLSGQPWAVSLVLKTLGKDRGYVERQEIAGVPDQPLGISVVEIHHTFQPGED